MTCLDGRAQRWPSDTFRYRLLHIGAVLVRRGRRLHLAPGRDLALGWSAQTGLLEVADRCSHNTLGPAPDPTTVSPPEGVTSDESRDL